MLDLAIIIVSYNTRAELEQCLESLHQPPPITTHEIIVVDNGSEDGSPRVVERWPDVRVIEVGTNVGFARACNTGMRASSAANLLLLNSDTIVPPHAVDRLIDELRRHPDVAVVGPRLIDRDRRVELSFGRMIGPFNELRQKVLMSAHRGGHWRVVSAWVERMSRRPHSPDWVSGACLLVRTHDALAVGLLDERYFMYAEDVDFCAAIRARGRAIRFTPDVEIVHLRGRSAANAVADTERAYRRSQLAFYGKHHPRWMPLLRLYLRLRRIQI